MVKTAHIMKVLQTHALKASTRATKTSARTVKTSTHDPVAPHTVRQPMDTTFFLWLLLAGVMIFFLGVLYDQNVIATILQVDRTLLSLVIMVLFFVASASCGIWTFQLSREMNIVAIARQSRMKADDLPPSLLKRYALARGDHDAARERALLEELNTTLVGYCEIGWLVSDLLIKIGLVGTLIGFIIMLASVAQTASLNVDNLRAILEHMSSGMRIALYTTLSGLIGSILLTVQYYILERGIDVLHARIRAVATILRT